MSSELLSHPAEAFGVAIAAARGGLEALRGSFLSLAEDEEGPYWTYTHPTINDAFASYVAGNPELVEMYLKGAKPDNIVREVVCSGAHLLGAKVVVPASLQNILLDRIVALPSSSLGIFISYRSSASFTKKVLISRPDIWKRLDYFTTPLNDDSDVDLLIALHKQKLLPEEMRLRFIEVVRGVIVNEADASVLTNSELREIVTKTEMHEMLNTIKSEVLGKLDKHIKRVRGDWNRDYSPKDHFEQLTQSIDVFALEVLPASVLETTKARVRSSVQSAVAEMEEEYEPNEGVSAPTQQSVAKADSLEELFRDVDN